MTEVHMLDNKLMNGVPIIDPITKTDKTPHASGDLKSYLSMITPKLGSRHGTCHTDNFPSKT